MAAPETRKQGHNQQRRAQCRHWSVVPGVAGSTPSRTDAGSTLGQVSVPEPDGWSSEQLLDHAHANGYPAVTERQLETWRHQQLLPRPQRVRQAGRTPIWLSRPDTGAQLLRLCQLRRQRAISDPHRLRLLLWLSGIELPAALVQASLQAVLAQLAADLDKGITATARQHGLHGAPEQVRRRALTLLGEQAAGQRGVNTVLPRLPSARGHRNRAFSALFCLFVEGEAPPAEIGTGADVDRLLGLLPRGRHDPVGDIRGWCDSHLDLDYIAQVASLPALRAAAETATEEDLRYARRAAAPLTRGLAFLSSLAAGFYRDKYAGLTLLGHTGQGVYTEPCLVALVVSLRHTPAADNLDSLVETLDRVWTRGREQVNQLPLVLAKAAERGTRVAPHEIARLRSVIQQFKPSLSHRGGPR